MRRTSSVWSLAAAAVFAIVGVVSLNAQLPGGSVEGKKLKNPVAMSPASIAAGKATYTKNCAFCHGPEAKGDGKMAPKDSHPSDLTDAKWERGSSDGEIFLVRPQQGLVDHLPLNGSDALRVSL